MCRIVFLAQLFVVFCAVHMKLSMGDGLGAVVPQTSELQSSLPRNIPSMLVFARLPFALIFVCRLRWLICIPSGSSVKTSFLALFRTIHHTKTVIFPMKRLAEGVVVCGWHCCLPSSLLTAVKSFLPRVLHYVSRISSELSCYKLCTSFVSLCKAILIMAFICILQKSTKGLFTRHLSFITARITRKMAAVFVRTRSQLVSRAFLMSHSQCRNASCQHHSRIVDKCLSLSVTPR